MIPAVDVREIAELVVTSTRLGCEETAVTRTQGKVFAPP